MQVFKAHETLKKSKIKSIPLNLKPCLIRPKKN
jgi:hypothetical protein